MATFSVTIDRTGMDPSTDLVIQGNERAAGWNAMEDWQVPDPIPVTSLASNEYQHGTVGTHWTFQDAVLSGNVFPVVASGPALKAAVAELRAAITRLDFQVTVDDNGNESTWRVLQPGSLTRSPLNRLMVERHEPVFTLTLTVYPVEVA